MSDNIKFLEKQAQKEIRQHFHNRNMLMLEAVISAMLDVDGAFGVARILREHADQLEEYS